MAGIVDELQRDAADPNVSIAVLLRKVKIVASKLSIGDVTDWVENELNRYQEKPPEYRQIRGIPNAFNPYHGWQQIQSSAKVIDVINQVWVTESVSSLEALVEKDDGAIHYPLPPDMVDHLVKSMNVPLYQMSNVVQRSQILAILDTIRNRILDWALKLERSGITGEGFSFTAAEKTMAKDPSIHIGAIHNFTGNLGSGNKSGDITANIQDKSKALIDLVHQARQYAPQLIEAGADADKLLPTIELLEDEIKHPVIDAETVTPLVQDLRNSVSGAAGNLIASGLLAAIAAVAG